MGRKKSNQTKNKKMSSWVMNKVLQPQGQVANQKTGSLTLKPEKFCVDS